ncbi:MAG: FtsQ-type POTRA domain-containing protein [Proteobacteria bacterium]|nr:FtsQ-type POTRA domain-containing protein [Pseudomonadota bacterium]MBU1649178.1 FtsQ-type POTRA domain-containing protein [Pseudomonadota bacterium]
MNIFKIQEISINGCRKTSPALIRELTGIRYQASLLRLNPEHIAAILRAHPWIAAVEVKRDWPDVVVVSIKEYAAEALIAQDVPGGKQFFYLDKSGVVFAPVEPGQDMDLPVITGLEAKEDNGQGRSNAVRDRDSGSGDGGRSEMISEALTLLKLVRQNNPNLPLQNLSEIHVDRDAGMTIYLADYPFPIYFGFGAVRTKYSRLKRVLEILYKETEQGMTIADVAYIRMDYLENKVLVAHSGSG